MRRCKWCGVFVRKDQPMTERLIRNKMTNPERRVAQLLCPTCSRSWSIDQSWNRPASERLDLPLEVLS